MANINLILNLKNHELMDEDNKLVYGFKHWEFDLKTKSFELDGMTIDYDLIYEFVYDRMIKTDKATVEIEDSDIVVDIDIDNEYEDYLEADLSMAVEDFIADKDLADGEYEVKYTYYYDFSDDEFVIEVQEVLESD